MEKEEFSNSNRNNIIWDCGSTLYDSYELNSFKSQLNSAIANSSRTLSMPHFPDHPYHHHHLSSLQQQQQQQQPKPPLPPRPSSNKSFKISRSFQKLFGLVFKSNKGRISSNTSSNNSFHQVEDKYCSNKEGFYVVYDDKSDQQVLSTIPELPEFEVGGLSPEISSLVRKSVSERFTPISTCISCAY